MNKQILNTKTYRDFKVDSGNIDKENRLVKIAFSSENPVERFFGNEILSHEAGAVDMTRLLDGAPLLLDHDSSKVIGVVENAKIDSDKIGRAVVRFSRNPEAELIFQDVIDGIRKKISVGYIINQITEVAKKSADAISTFLATSWTPLEVSIVGIPADSSVGVGRSEENINEENLENKNIKINERKIKMEEVKNDNLEKQDVIKTERERVSEIEATAKKFVGRVGNIEDLRTSAVRNGWSAEQFKAAVADKLSDGKPFETPNTEIGLSEKEIKNYSIQNLILTQIPNTGVRADFEREISNELIKKTGKAPRGLFVPYEVQKRDLLAGSGTGANLVGTQLRPESFIEMLYANQLAIKLGAKTLTGLNQNIAIPKRTAGATAYWVSENSAVTESASTFSQLTMSPKTVGAKTDFSRNLLMQGLPQIDQLITEDMAVQLAKAIDNAVFHGSGSSGEPTGLASQSGVGGVTITSNTITWANLLEYESDVLAANASSSNCKWATTPAIQAILKSKVKVSGDSREFAMGGDGKVNGYDVNVSSNISSGYLFFGDFSQYLIGYFGNLDVIVDPYSGSSAGTVAITAFSSVDCAARVPGAFSFSSGITG